MYITQKILLIQRHVQVDIAAHLLVSLSWLLTHPREDTEGSDHDTRWITTRVTTAVINKTTLIQKLTNLFSSPESAISSISGDGPRVLHTGDVLVLVEGVLARHADRHTTGMHVPRRESHP